MHVCFSFMYVEGKLKAKGTQSHFLSAITFLAGCNLLTGHRVVLYVRDTFRGCVLTLLGGPRFIGSL